MFYHFISCCQLIGLNIHPHIIIYIYIYISNYIIIVAYLIYIMYDNLIKIIYVTNDRHHYWARRGIYGAHEFYTQNETFVRS